MSGHVRSGQDQVRSSQVRLGQVSSGIGQFSHLMSGQLRSMTGQGHVRSGQVRSF